MNSDSTKVPWEPTQREIRQDNLLRCNAALFLSQNSFLEEFFVYWILHIFELNDWRGAPAFRFGRLDAVVIDRYVCNTGFARS
jgi:hypothetical protein